MSLKCLKELKKDLLLRFLTRQDVGVSLSRVDSLDIIDVDPSASVFVQLLEGLTDKLLSSLVHWSTDASNELIVVN